MIRSNRISVSKEIDLLNLQMQYAFDPVLTPRLQRNLVIAQIQLAKVDKTNKQQYVNAMTNVIYLQNRLTAPYSVDDILSQQIPILENILSSNLLLLASSNILATSNIDISSSLNVSS